MTRPIDALQEYGFLSAEFVRDLEALLADRGAPYGEVCYSCAGEHQAAEFHAARWLCVLIDCVAGLYPEPHTSPYDVRAESMHRLTLTRLTERLLDEPEFAERLCEVWSLAGPSAARALLLALYPASIEIPVRRNSWG